MDTYRRMLAVNVDGVFFGLQAAIPALRRSGGGSIVATASLAGLASTPPTPIYSLTKHAVVGLVRSAAVALESQGIRLSAIAPGFADTAIIAGELEKFHAANFPLLTADEVAAVVLDAFEGPPGAIWPIQPGRASEPYKFRGLPGPRAEGFTGALPGRAVRMRRRRRHPRRGASPEIVGPYLARVLGSPAWNECTVELIAGGKSNLTYAVTSSAAGEVVLRRPPLAAVLPTAHDMVREHRVLAALAGTPVPVPVGSRPLHGYERDRSTVLRDGSGRRPGDPRRGPARVTPTPPPNVPPSPTPW